MSSLRQRLKECVPPAYYSNGTEAKCMWYKVFNMFDIDPQSYIIDKEKKGMKISGWTVTESVPIRDFELSFSDPETQKQWEKNKKK